MRRALPAALAVAASLALAAPAQGAFGLNGFDAFLDGGGGEAATEAGAHPDSLRFAFAINYSGEGKDAQPDGEIKDATFRLIPGLAINPAATPRCTTAQFLAEGGSKCPAASRVGETTIELNQPGAFTTAGVFNLVPPPGRAARLGFRVEEAVPVVIDGGIESEPPYRLFGALRNTRQTLKVFAAELTLQGVPGQTPFLTLPTRCAGPQETSYEVLSWRGETDSGSSQSHDELGNPTGFLGCEKLPFAPEVSAAPTTRDAESSSGLGFELEFDQAGLLSPEGRAQSAVKDAVVTLPEGMTANPSLAEGLGVCTPADLGRETLAAAPGEGCPQAAKIGAVQVDTPLLDEPLSGSVYIAQPNDPDTAAAENPFDSLIAFYIVIKEPGLGVLVKLPAEVTPDPLTGQLVTRVRDAPQIPFERFSFRFREGQRAPLITPPACGEHTVDAQFAPWARPGEPEQVSASFRITAGPGGGPCPPGGAPPFEPGFEAGSHNNAAGAHSPFAMRLTRRDGDQDLTKLAATLPPGVSGRLAGLARCPDAQIAAARAKSGRSELASPSCPQGSAIGRTLAAAGIGAALTYVPGSLYLAGPYNGAPLSAVAITPAVAGPFDAGTVLVRVALRVDPRTAQVTADGAASDPIPHILQGIPLKVRELRVIADRPEFTLNPTSCAQKRVEATLWGSFLNVLDPADDRPVARFARYQAAGCQALGFAPRLDLRLRGGVRRGAFPALRAAYRPRPGHANLSRLALRFPRSAFVEQGHIRTICTRVQFAADSCPKAAIYGRARAFTPLLDEPLKGPVYLRSSNNDLPDAVFDLHGLVDLEVAVRIDSIRGGLRATVLGAPDAPVSRVIVNMRGGQRGLLVNSRHLCLKQRRNRADIRLEGHNAKRSRLRPLVRATACKKRKAKRSSHRSR